MALPRRSRSPLRLDYSPPARNLCRAQRTDREVRSGGDAGYSCSRRRGTEAKTSGREYSSCRPEDSGIPTSDHDGKSISSSDLLAKGRLVLCFIRGRWCPFCVGQMEAMNLILPEIEQAGATLVAISPQTVQQSFFMRDQHKLRFPLLSDAGNKVARQFGLTYRVPDEQRAVYQRAFVNLPFVNGDDSWELADSCDLHHRSRWHRALCFSERGLHGASRAGGHRALSRCDPQGLKPNSSVEPYGTTEVVPFPILRSELLSNV